MWKVDHKEGCLYSILKSRDITLPIKICLVKAMVSPVVMYGCESWTIKKAAAAAQSLQSCPILCDPIDGSPPGSPVPGILQARTLEWVAISFSDKESWAPNNWCFWSTVLKKTLESPLDCKEIKPVNLKGNQSWIFTGRTDAEAETPILWLPDAKNWLIGKDPDAGKDWGQEEKGMTEDEMVGRHHQLYGHEFEQASWIGDGQESLACYSPWGSKESDTTEWLKWTELNWKKDEYWRIDVFELWC